jgi:antitoxin HigA-1
MTRMHNPPHPGDVLREYLGEITITEAAVKLGVNRVTLSRVVSGASGISADMAYRLAQAFGTSAEMWAGMQMQFDLYQASKLKRPKIERVATKNEVTALKGMFDPVKHPVSVSAMNKAIGKRGAAAN